MGILAWVILGLIAGVIARVLVPGEQPGGCITTIIIGIIGALIGGYIGAYFTGRGISGIDLPSIGLSVLGAVIFIVIWTMLFGRR